MGVRSVSTAGEFQSVQSGSPLLNLFVEQRIVYSIYYNSTLTVETERTPIRDRLPDHRLRCYKRGTLAPDDDRSDNTSMTNRPVEALDDSPGVGHQWLSHAV